MYDTSSSGILAGILMLLVMEILIFGLACVLVALGYQALFRKCGVPAWKAWVPFLNAWTFAQLGGYHGAFSLIPTVGIILPGLAVNKAFGKDDAGSVLGLIFLGSIWMWILGAGSAPYRPELMGTELQYVRLAGAAVPTAVGAGYPGYFGPGAVAPGQAPFVGR